MEKGLKNILATGKEYYEVRLESIGGLGANLCAKMLGELGVRYLDLNSTNFSSYGSEKTGTPVKGFIRYCDAKKEIREHSPVEKPDLLVIFHQALLKDRAVLSGCGKNSDILLAMEPGQERDVLTDLADADFDVSEADFYGVEAQKIAMETKSRINVVMLGATLKLMGLADTSVGQMICKDTLGKKYPDALVSNLEGMKRGYEQVRKLEFPGKGEVREKKQVCNKQKVSHKQPKWGYQTAPIGGVNPHYGSTVVADLSPSRQGYIPLFIKEKCINCGLCFSACPDMVFQFKKGEYKGKEMMVNQGLDYYHCKGCLRCVDVCPVNALVRGVESEHSQKDYFMPNQELLRSPEYYEEAGPDGYITSESYLTEKRMEGGEV